MNSFTKKITTILMCCAMLLSTTICALALESANTNEAGDISSDPVQMAQSLNQEIANMTASTSLTSIYEAIAADGDISKIDTAVLYNAVDTTSNDKWNQLAYDVPTAVSSIANLNLTYQSLVKEFEAMGYGETATLQIPTFGAGYSTDIIQQFHDVYGDLPDINLMSTGIPDGWTMSAIMSDASSKRDAMASGFTSGAAYQAVIGNISYGNIFAKAQETLKTPELASQATLYGIINSLNSVEVERFETHKDKSFSEITERATALTQDLPQGLSKEMQELYDKNVIASKARIELDYQTNRSDATNVLFMLKDMMKNKIEEQRNGTN